MTRDYTLHPFNQTLRLNIKQCLFYGPRVKIGMYSLSSLEMTGSGWQKSIYYILLYSNRKLLQSDHKLIKKFLRIVNCHGVPKIK